MRGRKRERGLGRVLECDVEGRVVGLNETGGELGGHQRTETSSWEGGCDSDALHLAIRTGASGTEMTRSSGREGGCMQLRPTSNLQHPASQMRGRPHGKEGSWVGTDKVPSDWAYTVLAHDAGGRYPTGTSPRPVSEPRIRVFFRTWRCGAWRAIQSHTHTPLSPAMLLLIGTRHGPLTQQHVLE